MAVQRTIQLDQYDIRKMQEMVDVVDNDADLEVRRKVGDEVSARAWWDEEAAYVRLEIMAP